MSKERIKRIHLIYGWVTAVLVLAVGIALILSCLAIYRSGDRPFTPEAIGQHFQRIAPLIFACAAAVVGGLLLCVFLPSAQIKPKAVRSADVTLRNLAGKAAPLSDGERKEVKKEHDLRLLLRCGAGLLIVASAAYPTAYFWDSTHFTIENLNADIIRAASVVLTAAAVSVVIAILCSCLVKASMQRKITLYRRILAAPRDQQEPESIAQRAVSRAFVKNVPEQWRKPLLLTVRCAVFLLAVNLIILGIFNEGILDVLGKAIRICTECVGLG